MDGVAVGIEGGLVDSFCERRVGVDGRVDLVGGELHLKGESHFCDQLGGIVTNDVGSE